MIIKYTSNQDIDIDDGQDIKLEKLRDIKRALINNPNNAEFHSEEYQRFFDEKEYKMLEKIVSESNNKRRVKELYNKLMKLIRKAR